MVDTDERKVSRPRVQKRDGKWWVVWLLPLPDGEWLVWNSRVGSLAEGVDSGRRGCPVTITDVTPARPVVSLLAPLGEPFASFGGAA